jgi:alkanesulfonate monooxygenase SsuD/methylene tetrahydromethanopterin reductase-like flavin-dependent oxidoreductase (luciferase family)
LAKALTALDVMSQGRLVAGVGPGSSGRDYEAVGFSFEERWKRFDESVAILRALLRGEDVPPTRFYAVPEAELVPRPHRSDGIPIWIGSWGSHAGLRRVARLADGWLASAYNTSPELFAAAKQSLAEKLAERGRDPGAFPNALVTMWTWVSEDDTETARMLDEVLAPLLRRDAAELRDRLCIGYAQAGCEWVQLWPLGDERRQIELLADSVLPELGTDA